MVTLSASGLVPLVAQQVEVKITHPAVFAGLSLLLVVLAFASYYRMKRVTQRAAGEVVRVRKDADGDESQYVRFTTHSGEDVEFLEQNSWAPRRSVGERVEVWYSPSNPSDATSHRPGLYWRVWVFAAMAAAFAAYASVADWSWNPDSYPEP